MSGCECGGDAWGGQSKGTESSEHPGARSMTFCYKQQQQPPLLALLLPCLFAGNNSCRMRPRPKGNSPSRPLSALPPPWLQERKGKMGWPRSRRGIEMMMLMVTVMVILWEKWKGGTHSFRGVNLARLWRARSRAEPGPRHPVKWKRPSLGPGSIFGTRVRPETQETRAGPGRPGFLKKKKNLVY